MKLNKIIIFVMMFVMLIVSVNAQEYVDSYTIFEGTYISGDIDSLVSIDDDKLIIEEITTPLGMDVEFHFNNVTTFESVNVDLQYTGVGTSHIVDLEIYNQDSMEWVTLQEFSLGEEFDLNFPLAQTGRFIDVNGTVKTRIHHPQIGSTSHQIEIDRMVLLPADEQPVENTCPADLNENMLNFFWLFCILVIIVLGIFTNQPIIGLFGSIGLLFFSLSIIQCLLTLGIVLIGTSIGLMLYFVFKEN